MRPSQDLYFDLAGNRMNDKVTVYIVTHNRKDLLQRAIDSVKQQTYSNIELIVIDDASSDGTAEMVAKLNEQYPIIYRKNEVSKGACYSRNRALELASGHFITGMDDDDYFGPSRVADLVSHYDEKFALVCANSIELKQDGEKPRCCGLLEGSFTLEQLLHNNVVGNQMLTTTAKLKEVGGFDEEFPAFQDYDTWVRLVARFGEGLKINAYNYYLETEHGGERISSSNQRKLNGLNMFLKRHQDKMKPAHIKSMKILEKKVSGSRLSLWELFRLTHTGNYKSSISLYLNQRKAG